jgi:phage repressor protein C with HTH and peptisase S24 domain
VRPWTTETQGAEAIMSWANYVTKLRQGETVSFRPRGNSMRPRIESGQLVTVAPDTSELRENDIVFCRVKGKYFVHRISAILGHDRYQISNNRGHVNGVVARDAIFGKVVRVE